MATEGEKSCGEKKVFKCSSIFFFEYGTLKLEKKKKETIGGMLPNRKDGVKI